MNKIATVSPHSEEITGGLPTGYDGGNQSLAVSLARAEVDQQITTARAYPRSITKAVQNIMTLATLDAQSAEECIYALPRGGKPIMGPSIRLAEIIAAEWGNCRVGARVVHVDRMEKYVEAEGVFHDLESNTATTARVRRRLSDRSGRLLNDDMIVVTGNAAAAIAKRNAILGGVPKAVWRKAYNAVEQVIAGDVKTLAVRRDGAMKAFAAFGVKPEQIFTVLGIGGLDDIDLDHMITLTGMHSSLKSGEETVETLFPAKAVEGKTLPPSGKAMLDQFASDKPTEQPAAKAEPQQAATEEAAHDPDTGELPSEHPAAEERPEPSVEPWELGRQARDAGKSLRSVPPEWRTEQFAQEATDWGNGWRERDAELAKGGGK